jgi:hypothetical protein
LNFPEFHVREEFVGHFVGRCKIKPEKMDPGICADAPAADPMIAARAAPYAIGLGRRLTEGAKHD